jgi:hypothetical protein
MLGYITKLMPEKRADAIDRPTTMLLKSEVEG